MANVGIYTSPMDAMGTGVNIHIISNTNTLIYFGYVQMTFFQEKRHLKLNLCPLAGGIHGIHPQSPKELWDVFFNFMMHFVQVKYKCHM